LLSGHRHRRCRRCLSTVVARAVAAVAAAVATAAVLVVAAVAAVVATAAAAVDAARVRVCALFLKRFWTKRKIPAGTTCTMPVYLGVGDIVHRA